MFNRFTGTSWAGTHYPCTKMVLILRGVAQGTPTLQLADEWEWDYGTLLHDRHPMPAAALLGRDGSPLADAVTEGDEMFQNAGEKGDAYLDLADPPRHRANSPRERGTMANDRPPIQGVVGRDSGEIRLTVCEDTRQATIQPDVETKTREGVAFYSDESSAYNKVDASGRLHGTCLLYTSPSPRDGLLSRMPSSA